ncbi:DUF4258 domain-containing protein [Candidatus Woesearchaeota archaeon]|nr:DUF4258 domain-containing protein [Candidatus Woesearchaeota archaeon]
MYLQVNTGDTLDILFSKHARERMIERGISSNEVKEAIVCGSKQLQKPNKIISDYQYFSVVYKKMKNKIFIITVKPRW